MLMVFIRKFLPPAGSCYWHEGVPGLDYSARYEQELARSNVSAAERSALRPALSVVPASEAVDEADPISDQSPRQAPPPENGGGCRAGGGDAAGQPPRQLQGFGKVTLRPGQSTTVRFRLNGHELSYWNDSASGWVVPVGRFGVYVGDSSALANLPLQGSFTVTRGFG